MKHILAVLLTAGALLGSVSVVHARDRVADDADILQQDLSGGIAGSFIRYWDFETGAMCYSAYKGEFDCISFDDLPLIGQQKFVDMCKAHSKTPQSCPAVTD